MQGERTPFVWIVKKMLPRSVAIGWGLAHRGSNPDVAVTKAGRRMP